MTPFKVVIPARYASSRLPGKPLVDIAGKPMIWHSWQRGLDAAASSNDVVIATDDERIFDVASAFGANTVMTSMDHDNGSERIGEVADIMGWSSDTIVVNLQGDEPLLPPGLVKQVAADIDANTEAAIATLGYPIQDPGALSNPNIVKVVRDKAGFAHYFSRACIPHDRSASGNVKDTGNYPYLRHIGLYAYRVHTLRTVNALEAAPTEVVEKLEQLRALWHGLRIYVGIADIAPPQGVDTPADLDAVRRTIAEAG